MSIKKDLLKEMFRTMSVIRCFEEQTIYYFKKGFIPGWLHSCIGQEAVATGACMTLNKDDYITSTHRGHGHCIAKGADLKKMMAELFARETGYCKGKGGSMHISDASIGMLGANGVVGGGIPIATGAGIASSYLKNRRVCISFFGDGASNQGSFHESLNLASIWDLPVIYICENNQYALTTNQKIHKNIDNIADRAKAYGIPGVICDGNDVIDVYKKVSEAVNKARNYEGPTLIEAKTYRIRGHWEGDPEAYRPKEEVAEWMENDPIKKFSLYLLKEKIFNKTELEQIEKDSKKEVEEAIEFAKNSPPPADESALEDVFC